MNPLSHSNFGMAFCLADIKKSRPDASGRLKIFKQSHIHIPPEEGIPLSSDEESVAVVEVSQVFGSSAGGGGGGGGLGVDCLGVAFFAITFLMIALLIAFLTIAFLIAFLATAFLIALFATFFFTIFLTAFLAIFFLMAFLAKAFLIAFFGTPFVDNINARVLLYVTWFMSLAEDSTRRGFFRIP